MLLRRAERDNGQPASTVGRCAQCIAPTPGYPSECEPESGPRFQGLLAPVRVQRDRWRGGRSATACSDEGATLQVLQRGLDAALGEPGRVGDHAQAEHDAARTTACFPPQVKVDQEGCGPAIVSDQIGHERIENVAIDGDAVCRSHLDTDYYSN